MLYYKYKTLDEILKNTSLVNDFWIFDYFILIVLIFIVLFFILYLLPIKQIYSKILFDKAGYRKRKKLLNQIMSQKAIEDEIAEEIKNYNLKA